MRLLSLLLLIAIVGCTSTTDTAPVTAPAGSTLSGSVFAYASSSATAVSSEGITVSIQGTSFQTVTDTGGHFSIAGIPAGVYNIIFSKPGFDSMIYPVHHLIGVGTDIINDAYLISEASDSVALKNINSVFRVSSTTRTITITDSLFHDSAGYKIFDTAIRRDSVYTLYDTVQNASAMIVTGSLIGSVMPGNVYVYSSLDSAMWPYAAAHQNTSFTEDAWLSQHLVDTAYHGAFQSPRINGGIFVDTLGKDIETLKPYSLGAGQPVYIFVVGHSSTEGLPVPGGEYQHYYTTPYGPRAVRFTYIVP